MTITLLSLNYIKKTRNVGVYMKKKFTIGIALILIPVFLIIGFVVTGLNESQGGITEVFKVNNFSENNNYTFIYSHPTEKTQLLSTRDGKEFNVHSLNYTDIFNSEIAFNNEILLWPTHEDYLLRIDQKNNLTKEKLSSPLNFIKEDKGITIKALNHDLTTNILKVDDRTNKKQYDLDFPTFLVNAYLSQESIYLLNDDIEKEKSVIHIINRNKGELQETISLPGSAQDVTEFQGNIVIGSDNKLTVLNKETLKTTNIPYPANNIFPDKLYVKNDQLFLSYGNLETGSINLLIFDESLQVVDQIDLEAPLTVSKFKNDKLYVLSQYEMEQKYGGLFTIFDLNSLKIEKEINLPKEDIKVQDFILLSE